VKNIRHDQHGTQAHFGYKGHQYTKRWKVSEFPSEKERVQKARDWLTNARAHLALNQPVPESTGPRFEADAVLYLAAVTSMPSYSDRAYHIQQWTEVFRGRDKADISPLEIRTQLERWRRSLSASSCNKRRTALMSFYTKLNGRSGYNPVRDVEPYQEESEIRSQHPYTILRVLSFMRPSQTRARLMVILTTGWPHAQLKRLRPEHLKLEQARAYVTPRRKGKGRKGAWLPLLPAAVKALREFQQWDCFSKVDEKGKLKTFSHNAMYVCFARALAKLNAHRAKLELPPLDIRPYDLRHTFGTWLAHRLTDERAIQELMMHSRPEQTRRYTEAATQGRLERAMVQLAASSSPGSQSVRIPQEWTGVETAKHTAKR
jgi:integrase